MKRLLFLLGSLFLTSCFIGGSDVYYCRAFVMGYRGMDGIYITQGTNKLYYDIVFSWSREEWGVYFEKERDYYEALCQKHGDVSYNRRVRVFHSVDPIPRMCCARDFVELEIWSDTDWDADHPAGTSLNDLLHFWSTTPLPYIRSGYTEKYSEEEDGEYYPISKRVSELTRDDMTLLPHEGFFVHFDRLPQIRGNRKLFVRLTADDGTVFEANKKVEF
ncbi:MAG: hypothetical protein NC209_05755 [Alistipes sp.]|nr:hypothetical protein [Alistipes senegalensis]MCM1250628.1 hypothetical protein [Alistipes sp.]